MKKLAVATMFSAAIAFGMPAHAVLHAQQSTTTAPAATTTTDDHDADKAKDEAHKAGEEAKDAAKKTGAAVKHSAKATGHATKSTAKTVAKDTKHASKAVAHDTKGAVKTSGNDAKSIGNAIKDDVTGEHKNATAKCTDGTFWYSAERAGACGDHGGVATWMK